MKKQETREEVITRYVEYIEQLAADARFNLNNGNISYGLDPKLEGIIHWAKKAQKQIELIEKEEGEKNV